MGYIAIFFALLFLCTFIGGSKILLNTSKIEGIHIVVFLGIWFLIGLRATDVGTDTITYMYDFLKVREYSSILYIFRTEPEPLYILLRTIGRKLTDNYTIMLFIFAIPMAWAFTELLKKWSDDYFLSVLIFSVLEIFYFSMAGIRQTIAMGIAILAIKYAYERKPIPFFILCLIAYGFHNSVYIFLIVYFIMNIKVGMKQWIAVLVCYILGLTKNSIVMELVRLFMDEERFGNYTDGETSELTLSMFYIKLMFVILCFIFKDDVLKENPKYKLFYNTAFVGLCLQAFTPILGEFFRASMYFSVVLCVLVPKAINSIKDRQTKIFAYLGVVACCLIYTFAFPDSYVYMYHMFF